MPVRIPGPIDLEACLFGGQAFHWRRVDGGYEGVVGERLVRVRAEGKGAVVEGLPERRARRYFRADDDVAAVRRRLAGDPAVASSVRRWPGLRPLRTEPWPCLVSFVLSQNSNVPRIQTTLERIADALGPQVGPRHALPGPGRLADAGEQRLRELGAGYRAPYLVAAAERVAAGALDLDALADTGYEAARAELLDVPGIGPKVAECVLLFGLHDRSAFPVDRWVARSLAERLPDAPDPPDDARAFARNRFGDDAGFAQQFLFHDRREAGR